MRRGPLNGDLQIWVCSLPSAVFSGTLFHQKGAGEHVQREM